MNDSASTPSPATDKPSFIALLGPVLARVAALEPESRTSAEAQAELERLLREGFPADGPLAQAIGATIEVGVAEGWLCERGTADARFGRVAKPCEETHGLSIDVVRLAGAALRHGHPKGEVTLGFAVEGTPRFDGRDPGWTFAGPGSVHVPEVNAGRMNLIYFLPEGSVDWDPKPSAS